MRTHKILVSSFLCLLWLGATPVSLAQGKEALKAIDPSQAEFDTPPPAPAANQGTNPFGSGIQGQPLGAPKRTLQNPNPPGGNYPPDNTQPPNFGPAPGIPSQAGQGWNPPAPAGDNSAYDRRVERLEQMTFGSPYPEHDTEDRLDHLENEVFGKKNTGMPADQRLSRLESKLLGQTAFGQASLPPPSPPPAARPGYNVPPYGSSQQQLPNTVWLGAAQPYPNQGAAPPYPVQGVAPPYPGQGVAPAYPNQGVAPAYPNQGVAPAYPNQGVAPAYPNQGVAPAYPNQGVAPAYPNQGVAPAYPNQGAAPPYPNQGFAPAYPNQGVAPAYPNQRPAPPYPNQGFAPAYPNQGVAPAYPNQRPAQPYPNQGAAPPYPNQGAVPTYPNQRPALSYPSQGAAPPYPDQRSALPYPNQGAAPPCPNQQPALPYPNQGAPSGYYPPTQPQFSSGQAVYQQYPAQQANPVHPSYAAAQPGGQGIPLSTVAQQDRQGTSSISSSSVPSSTLPPDNVAPKKRLGLSSSDRADGDVNNVAKSIPQKPGAGDYFGGINKFTAGVVARWTSFPVLVHLPQGSPANWQRALEESVGSWGRYIPVRVAAPSEAADIEIAWINHLAPRMLGQTNLEVFNGRVRVTVYLLRPSYYLENISEKMLRKVAEHEVGHAIGIFGHSADPADLMYPLETANPKNSTKYGGISARDLNTLRRIYESPALPPGFQSPHPMGWNFSAN